MRKQLLGLIVPLLAFVLIASAADMTGKGAAAGAQLERLDVAHSQDGLRVEFKAKGTLAPKLTTLDSPACIVVDLPNTVMATSQSHVVVDQDGVKDVRSAMDGHGNTRVVVDLTARRQHELVSGAQGGFVLKIADAGERHESAAAGKPAAIPAPKLVLASAPAASVPALEAGPGTSKRGAEIIDKVAAGCPRRRGDQLWPDALA